MPAFRLITVSNKSADWVQQGFNDYVKRLRPAFSLELIEIPVIKRTSYNTETVIQKEGEKILNLIKPGNFVIALEVTGKSWSTEKLAEYLSNWQQEHKHIDLIIGGPDGLSADCLKRANLKWSLSPLTLPHLLVRVMVAEQLYRAWTILQGHPYHK